jgi:hypothetical protein
VLQTDHRAAGITERSERAVLTLRIHYAQTADHFESIPGWDDVDVLRWIKRGMSGLADENFSF